MTRLPRTTGKDVLAALRRAGFEEIRQRGSHVFLSHPDDRSRWATVAAHSGRVLPLGTLRAVLSTAKLTVEELLALID